jgi:hypothetical protein
MKDFIGIYDNILTAEQCQHFIDKFDKSSKKKPGSIGSGVDIAKKDSMDIEISPLKEWQNENNIIAQATLTGLIQYVREYPFLLVGAISTSIQDPKSGKVKTLGIEDIIAMDDIQLGNIVKFVYRLGSVNIQKYKKSSGGYHHWHSEFYPHPRDPEQSSLHRVLLFSFYLNDVDDGGETEFYYQNAKVQPKTGRMIIAPATFTHTHKGHIPKSNDKYFMTSWILFQQSKHLYQQPG